MSARTYTRSFAGGVVTPELFGRLDLTKNQTGLQTCRNFVVLPHGPAQNRAGFGYVLETKDSTKASVLLPFIFSTTQTYVLEFGNLYMRIHTAGGTVLEATKNITGITQPAGVVTSVAHGYTNGQWLFLAGIGGMTQLNGRFIVVSDAAADTFRMKDFAGNYITTGSYGAYTAGGTAARVYEIVTPFLEADLFDLHYTQSSDVLTITHPNYAVGEVKRLGATNWTYTNPSFAPTIGTPAAPTLTTSAAGATTYTYVVTAVATDGLEESLASPSANITNDLATAGHWIDIDPPVVAGAVRYNIYKLSSGLYGYIGQTDGSAFRDTNFTADTTRTPPINDAPFGSTDNYPGAVGYFNGRRWFGGTNLKQQNLWATRSGTESNMSYSIPTRDDDSIRVRLTSRQANRILHIVPLSDLLLLTSGAEWSITSQNSDAITPTSISYRPEDYIGASNVQPVVTSSAVLYGQARGGRLREMKIPDSSINGRYRTNDISILAPHLFDDYTLTSMTFTRARTPVHWSTRNDGTLLGITYVPEQQVAAWHHHDTAGAFKSVCGVPEGNEDALYAIVQRTINGRSVRCVERQASRQFTQLQDCVFVDSGLSINNTIAATLTPGAGATVVGTANVIFTAGSAVFAATDVGRYIHYDFTTTNGEGVTVYHKAQAVITGYTDTTHVTTTIDVAWPSLTAIASAGWRMTVTTLSGFWHLIGETVSILGDGAVFPPQIVSATGTLTLEQGVSIAHVGLAYTCDLETVPLTVEATAAAGQGMPKNVNKAWMRLYQSSNVFIGPSSSNLKQIKQRTTEPYGSPPEVLSGVYPVNLTPSWQQDGSVFIRQSDPLPVTAVSMTLEVALGGG